MSTGAIGSSAHTSMMEPGSARASARREKSAGKGHLSPRRSNFESFTTIPGRPILTTSARTLSSRPRSGKGIEFYGPLRRISPRRNLYFHHRAEPFPDAARQAGLAHYRRRYRRSFRQDD